MEFTVCINIWILLIYWLALTEGQNTLFLSCFLLFRSVHMQLQWA